MGRTLTAATKYNRIDRWARRYQRILLLHAWSIEIKIMDAPCAEDTLRDINLLNCHPDLTYATLYVWVYPAFWEQDKLAQERRLLHEMMHAITEPFDAAVSQRFLKGRPTSGSVRKAQERATEDFCNIVWHLTHGRRRKPAGV